MADTSTMKEPIGGFGFPALQHWYGPYVQNIINSGGVWDFLKSKKIPDWTENKMIPYEPCIANVGIVHCLEQHVDALHLYPRQSRMTMTAVLYTQYVLEKTDGKAFIFWYSSSIWAFQRAMRLLARISEQSSPAYRMAMVALHNGDNSYVPGLEDGRISAFIRDADASLLSNTKYPVYVFVEDALYIYEWEKHLANLKLWKKDGTDITLCCFSTLNQTIDSVFREFVRLRLLGDSHGVFFNDEIFYKAVPDDVTPSMPAIMRYDFRFIHKDAADQYKQDMVATIATLGHNCTTTLGETTLMSELYLQYASFPMNFIGK